MSIHRGLLDSGLWRGEKFTRGQAWVDLILNANHAENRVWLKGKPITVNRGEQIRSKVTLVKTWKWNERTVSRFLNMLELEGMITQKSTNQTTHITICNYSKYQDKEGNSTDQSTKQSTRRVQNRVQTNNNDNNDNNTKNKPSPKLVSGVPYQKIVDLYHKELPTLPKIEKLTATRKAQIRQRWLQDDLPDLNNWENFFDYVKKSKFLMGGSTPVNGHRVFTANLEWLTKESNFVKITEGNYHNG